MCKSSKSLVPTQHTAISRPEDHPDFKWRETPLAKDVAGPPRQLEMNYKAGPGDKQVVDPGAQSVNETLGIEEIRCEDYGEWEMRDADGHVLGVFTIGMGDTLAKKVEEVLEEQARHVEHLGPGYYQATMTRAGKVRLQQVGQAGEEQSH